MESAQQDLVKTDPSFAEFLVSVKKAHITLLVFRVDWEEMEKARIIFDTVVKEKIVNHFNEDVFDVQFEGVGAFEEQIVFMKPISGVERMKYMNQELLKAFTAAGYNCDPVFTPHVTLVKQKFGKGKEMGKIPSDWLKKFKNKYFGIQKICGIELLSMSKPMTEEGYFASKGAVWFIGKCEKGDHGEVME